MKFIGNLGRSCNCLRSWVNKIALIAPLYMSWSCICLDVHSTMLQSNCYTNAKIGRVAKEGFKCRSKEQWKEKRFWEHSKEIQIQAKIQILEVGRVEVANKGNFVNAQHRGSGRLRAGGRPGGQKHRLGRQLYQPLIQSSRPWQQIQIHVTKTNKQTNTIIKSYRCWYFSLLDRDNNYKYKYKYT